MPVYDAMFTHVHSSWRNKSGDGGTLTHRKITCQVACAVHVSIIRVTVSNCFDFTKRFC